MIFPLHATSSMVTELAPFLIALRSSRSISLLVFEEPEAHLHLSAQRIMAQALARIVNLGVTVIVTSHSDTFVQEINNLIQIHQSADRQGLMKKFGYEDADLIDPKKIKGYEFTQSGDETEVCELKLIPQGFVVPSLNESLRSLAEETVAIQQKGEADDD